jgi:Flp pilus assembly protein TadG
MVTRAYTKRQSKRSFLRNEAGNVAMMWGLMGAVLIGLIGITVDFTRAQALQNQMQNAADGAALVAERSSNLSMAQRTAAARAFFDAEMGNSLDAANLTFSVTQLTEGGHQVSVSMPMNLSLARIINGDDWDLAVQSTAEANASPPIEVALVLDNTGSMSADMPALRSAAADLVGDLLSLDGDTVRVSVVPFVAQVNIGNGAQQMAWMDTTGVAPMNGELFEDRMIGYVPRLNSSTNRNHTGATCQDLSDRPWFDNTATGTNEGYPGPYRVVWRHSPTIAPGYCFAFTPADGINYFTLFDLIPNDDWKGCVEARPEPFDINDAAPTISDPRTLFTPFFWLDTGGSANQSNSSSSSAPNYRNSNQSYLDDTPADLRAARASVVNASGATATSTNQNNAANSGSATGVVMSSGQPPALDANPTAQQQREARFFNVFKYRGVNASIDSTDPDTRGPNRGCPTPIVPLTSNETIVQSAVSGMRHWQGGGTNQAEGLAWGWRVLSPTAPFTEGAAYGPDVRKVIVLMSDGENTNVGTDAVMASDYSAYNHMGFWRDFANGSALTELLFGILHGILPPGIVRRNIDSGTEYVDYVDNRQRALCTAIKNAGIEIYVVRFRNGNEDLMRDCASSDEHFFNANSATELSQAFDAIGTGIGSLRLTH